MVEPSPKSAPSRTGALTVLFVLVFGGLFMGGLYLTAYRNIAPDYRQSTPGAPGRALRVVSWDLQWDPSKTAAAIEVLRPILPDLVLLQRVSRKEAQTIGLALDMRARGALQMYYSPTNAGDPGEPGNAILCRFPL